MIGAGSCDDCCCQLATTCLSCGELRRLACESMGRRCSASECRPIRHRRRRKAGTAKQRPDQRARPREECLVQRHNAPRCRSQAF
jgi:hypothetical protein